MTNEKNKQLLIYKNRIDILASKWILFQSSNLSHCKITER